MDSCKKVQSVLDENKTKLSSNDYKILCEEMQKLYKAKSYCKVLRFYCETRISMKNDSNDHHMTKMTTDSFSYNSEGRSKKSKPQLLKDLLIKSKMKQKVYNLEIKEKSRCKLPVDFKEGYICDVMYQELQEQREYGNMAIFSMCNGFNILLSPDMDGMIRENNYATEYTGDSD